MQDVRDDIMIVKELTHGSESAFNELFHKYSRPLFLAALRRCDSNEADANDVVQDVFIKLWQIKGTLSIDWKRGGIYAYLFVMMKNACANKLDDRRTALKLNGKYIVGQETEFFPDYYENSELAKELHHAIESISAPATRRIMKLRYMDGKSYDEIRKIMNIQIQTARNLINRGVAILKKSFKKLP